MTKLKPFLAVILVNMGKRVDKRQYHDIRWQ